MRKQVKPLSSDEVVEDLIRIQGFGQVSRRQLSVDVDSGAETSRLKIRAGWTIPRSVFSADLELLVLSGRITVGVHSLQELSYSFTPKGIASGPWTAEEDTELLWMPHGDISARPQNDHEDGADHNDYTPAKDYEATPWRPPKTPGFYGGSMRKYLRTCPRTGSETWILGALGGFHDHRMEVHPVVEEAYILETSDPQQRGVGRYFWRPPHIYHGPFHSRYTGLIFFRTEGGPLETHYIMPRGEAEMDWESQPERDA